MSHELYILSLEGASSRDKCEGFDAEKTGDYGRVALRHERHTLALSPTHTHTLTRTYIKRETNEKTRDNGRLCSKPTLYRERERDSLTRTLTCTHTLKERPMRRRTVMTGLRSSRVPHTHTDTETLSHPHSHTHIHKRRDQ